MLKLYVKSLKIIETFKSECGQDSVEYAILIGIIAVAVVSNVATIATFVSSRFLGLAGAL
jgi:Flp pilus assembly pilin Flp